MPSSLSLISRSHTDRFASCQQNMKASKDRTEQFMYTSTSGSNLPPSNRASSSSFPSTPSSSDGPRLRRTVHHHVPLGPESILNAPPPNRAQSTSPFTPHGGQQGAMSRTSLDGGGYAVDQKGKGRGDYLALNLEDAEGGRGAGGAQVMQMQMMEEQVRPKPDPLVAFTPNVLTEPLLCCLLALAGQLHPVEIDRDRDDRVDHCRARVHFWAARSHGRPAGRDSPADRRRRARHLNVRLPVRALLSLLCIGTLMKTFSLTAVGHAGTCKAQRANCSSTTPA